MSRKLTRSNQHFQKAVERIPLCEQYNVVVIVDEVKTGFRVAPSGTYTCHSAALAAANKTLEILDETDAMEIIANYRDWLKSDYTFYDAMAIELPELGILCEPDSREPWFISEAHAQGDNLKTTLSAFEKAVDITLQKQND